MPSDAVSASSRRVWLDATSGPLHPAAVEALGACAGDAADPGARHTPGRATRHELDRARSRWAEVLGVEPRALSFLPSGAHALRVALDGLRHARRRVGSQVLASAVERAVVLTNDPPPQIVPVDRFGRVDPAEVGSRLTGTSAAVVAQVANGEVGTAQRVEELASVCRVRGVPLLLDATASGGHVRTPQGWDVLVADAQSWGGPPLGILAVRPGTRFLLPYAAEAEERSAVAPPWPPLVIAAEAALLATAANGESDAALHRRLTDRIRAAARAVPDVEVVGDPVDRLPHVASFSALFVDGEVLVEEFDQRGFAVASGSACVSTRLEPSHVLAAMGALTHGNVRITLPWPACAPALEEDVERFCATLPEAVAAARSRLGVADL